MERLCVGFKVNLRTTTLKEYWGELCAEYQKRGWWKMPLEIVFPKAMKACYEKYAKRKARHGATWKEMSAAELRRKLFEEIDEFYGTTDGTPAEREEIVDIAIVALMMLERVL